MTSSVSMPPPGRAAGGQQMPLPRQQISIERLPRRINSEPRESMNCKSCRKRKIKCNRMRPSCEACQVFQCQCVYDAVPKKRGPKTDVLEALLKRVDGLEAKLKEKNDGEESRLPEIAIEEADTEEPVDAGEPAQKRVAIETKRPSEDVTKCESPEAQSSSDASASPVEPDVLLHTYFARFHGKPYYILDESSVRQRLRMNVLPDALCYAIWALAARHTSHPQGHQAAARQSEEYALRARQAVDTDEPSIDNLQTLLLLVMAFTASGLGKKAYMVMTSAVGMAMALELHREIDAMAQVSPVDRELRRRLFWTCYLLDRFSACGSRRSSLINDSAIALRLPSWCPSPSSLAVDGEFFQQASNMQYFQGTGKNSQGNTGMLIDIARILGMTNQYLAAGGVKGDSHFPWHSLSTLSKIRQELDFWASGAGAVFAGMHALFQQNEATIAFLSKLIYHLMHCLIYRPFLPIDLAELAGHGQHQSWQIEATNLCFLHANAIGELVEAARQTEAAVEWPAIVGFCISTAATVHIHGAHYTDASAYGGEANIFTPSTDTLSREMHILGELQYSWASVRHQSDTLQGIYNAHGELVKSLASNAMRYSQGFHLEDFFDRYANIGGPGGQTFRFDPAHLSMSEIVIEFTADRYSESPSAAEASNGRKRKYTSSNRQRPDVGAAASQDRQFQMAARPAAAPTSVPAEATSTSHGYMAAPGTPGAAGHAGTSLTRTGFSPFALGPGTTVIGTSPQPNANEGAPYDPMFGGIPTNAFSSPAAWAGDDGQYYKMHAVGGVAAPSPGTKSATGSTGTVQSDEKDPFLNMLEQLAEDEQRFSGAGALNFFGGPGS